MRLVHHLSFAAASCLVALFTFPIVSSAQEVTAAITGRVTDPSGAAVPDAKVTATDRDRGTTWPATTNADGIYNLPRLPASTYDVKVEHPGFQTATISNVLLQLNQVARLDFPLQV